MTTEPTLDEQIQAVEWAITDLQTSWAMLSNFRRQNMRELRAAARTLRELQRAQTAATVRAMGDT